jgi:hypothetical protein
MKLIIVQIGIWKEELAKVGNQGAVKFEGFTLMIISPLTARLLFHEVFSTIQ